MSDGTVVRFGLSNGRGGVIGGWRVILPHAARRERIVLGRDAFVFSINLSADKESVSIYPNSYLGWNCRSVDKERERFIKLCGQFDQKKSGIYPDTWCTMLIYCNDWKIPDDYPLKF